MQQWNQSGSVLDNEMKEERIFMGILLTGLILSGILFAFYGLERTVAAVQPRYTINVQCRIPEPAKQMPIFGARQLSSNESLALGTRLGDAVGAVFDGISYTHSGSNFLDTNPDGGIHLITVSNEDGSYTYRGSKGISGYTEKGDPIELKKALEALYISVPNHAVFAQEEKGWFSFTAEESWSETSLVSGSLRCRFAKDGTLLNLENNIVTYTPQGFVETISVDAFLKKLHKGAFFEEAWLEENQSVEITAARIRYRQEEGKIWVPYMEITVNLQNGSYAEAVWIPLSVDAY